MAPSFLILALGGGEWSASCSSCFTPREAAPNIHWLGGSQGQSGCCGVEKNLIPLPGIEPQPSIHLYPSAILTEL
jgi:hypothetical protein